MTAGRAHLAPCGSLTHLPISRVVVIFTRSPESCVLFKHRNRGAFPGNLSRGQLVCSLSHAHVGPHML
eukprot:2248409-Pleurochrysis_carterae.AAC.2